MSQQPPGRGQPPHQGYPPQPPQHHPGYTHQGQSTPSGVGHSRLAAGVAAGCLGLIILGGIGGGVLVWYNSEQTAREQHRAQVATDLERRRQVAAAALEQQHQAADDAREQQRQAADSAREQQRQAAEQQRRDARAAKAASADDERKRLAATEVFNRAVLLCFHPTASYTGGTLGAEYADASGRVTQDGHVEFDGGFTGHGYSMDYVLHKRTDGGDQLYRVTPGKDTAFTKPNPSCALREWSRMN